MKLVVKLMVWMLVTWLPISGFAATGMPCHWSSPQMTSSVEKAQDSPCGQPDTHPSQGQTKPTPLPCHGGSGGLSCVAAAIPPTPLSFSLPSSAVYQPSIDNHPVLFIPEQPHRPPITA
jgi:hypothetical protein